MPRDGLVRMDSYYIVVHLCTSNQQNFKYCIAKMKMRPQRHRPAHLSFVHPPSLCFLFAQRSMSFLFSYVFHSNLLR